MDLQLVIEFAIAMWSEPGHRPPSFSQASVRQFLRGAAVRFQDPKKFLDTIVEISKESRDSPNFRVGDLRRALDLVARAQSIPDFTLDSLKTTNFSELSQPLSIQFVCIGIPCPTTKQVFGYDLLWPLTPEELMDVDFATLVWSAVEEDIHRDTETSGHNVVDHVLNLVDPTKTGRIGRDKFVMGMYLMEVKNSGHLLPYSMSDSASVVLESWIEESRRTRTSRIVASKITQAHNIHDLIVQSGAVSSGSNINGGSPPTPPTSTTGSNSSPSPLKYLRCPFCEKKLPKNMPNHLQCTLAKLLLPSNSRPLPSKDHPDRREATLGGFPLYASFCADHSCLTQVADAVIGNDWPSAGDVLFPGLEARARSLESELNQLVCHPSESAVFRRLLKMIEAEGLAEVRSFDGMLRRIPFEHAGYYGERGSLIIHRTLLKMFSTIPDHQHIFVDPARIYPLDHAEFLSSVLVPETSILLIQKDRNCSWSVATDHWKASRQYGMVMFHDELVKLPFE